MSRSHSPSVIWVKFEDLISYLETQKSVGQNMILTVYQDGQTIDKQITIGQRPSASPYLTNAPQRPYP
jgi:aconitase B